MISCIIISLSGPLLGREVLGWFVDMSAIGASIGYFFTCGSTLVTTRRDGDGSRLLKGMSVTGVCFLIAFMVLQLVSIPRLSGVHLCKESYLMFCAPSFTCLSAGSEFTDPFGPEFSFFVFFHKLQCFDGIVSKEIKE